MKKLLFIFFMVGQFSFAQQLNVTSISFIKNSTSCGFYYPKFSPSVDYLLVTSENYSGLKQINLNLNSVETITQDAGAGYDVQISQDGNSILYKKIDFENNLRKNSLMSYSRSTKQKVQIVAPSREAMVSKFSVNKPTFIAGRKMMRPSLTANVVQPLICIEDQKMVLYSATTRKVLTPNGTDASYIWPSISPDTKNIVYTVAGKGSFVCSISGTNVRGIGQLNAPVWLNNSWLVGMDDKDDGDRLISSAILAVSIDGKIRQTIKTPAGKMAMYPAASFDGKKIAFNTDKGELYIMNVEIK